MGQRRDGEWWLTGLPFGRGDAAKATPDKPLTLRPVRRRLLLAALSFLGAALVSTVVVIAVFDWSVLDVVVGGLVGALVWGSFEYLTDTGRLVRVELPPPPNGAVEPTDGSTWRWRDVAWTAAVLLAAVGLAWLADHLGLGAFFVPGQMVGYAADSLLGVVLIRRYEKAHGVRVLSDGGAADRDAMYAEPLT